MSNLEVAQTILNQLGGNGRLAMMCGCKDFAGDSTSVQFKIGTNGKRVTCCRIVLDPSDTYTVTFYSGRGVKMREAVSHSDVYADMLRHLFERETGMYLTF